MFQNKINACIRNPRTQESTMNNTTNNETKRNVTAYTHVVVTGGSSGIGNSYLNAIHNINPHAKIFNLSRTFLAKNLPDSIFTHIPCNLIHKNDVESVAHQLVESFNLDPTKGPILLINNSGFGSYGDFSVTNIEKQHEMILLNSVAPVLLTRLLLPTLKQRGGAIMNIASTAAFQPTPWMSTYGATKAFLLNWSLALNEELRGSGVQVLAVCPGPTATNFFKNAGFTSSPLPSNVGQTAEQVVQESLKALEQGKNLIVTGLSNKILTTFSSMIPKRWIARIAGKIIKSARIEQPK